MSSLPDFFVTGVWKDNSGRISHLLLHPNGATPADPEIYFGAGIKTAADHATNLIEASRSMMTLRWNYSAATWEKGAFIAVAREGNTKYLHIIKDASEEDHLDHVIRMNGLISGT